MLITAVPPHPSGLKSQYPPFNVTWRTFTMNGRIEIVACRKVDAIELRVPSVAALSEPSHEEIALRAYFKWRRAGAPPLQTGFSMIGLMRSTISSGSKFPWRRFRRTPTSSRAVDGGEARRLLPEQRHRLRCLPAKITGWLLVQHPVERSETLN
jgi:hypothetical protein